MLRISSLSASVLLVASSLVACAPPDENEAGPRVELLMSAAFMDRASGIRISIVKQEVGARPSPDGGTFACIKDAVTSNEDYVVQTDERGNPVRARLFPLGTDGGTLRGISPGSNYLFVCEVLSNSTPPQLLGFAKHGVATLKAAGDNPAVRFSIIGNPDGGVLAGCDPTVL